MTYAKGCMALDVGFSGGCASVRNAPILVIQVIPIPIVFVCASGCRALLSFSYFILQPYSI